MENIFKETGSLLHCKTFTIGNYVTNILNTNERLYLPWRWPSVENILCFYFLTFFRLVNRNYPCSFLGKYFIFRLYCWQTRQIIHRHYGFDLNDEKRCETPEVCDDIFRAYCISWTGLLTQGLVTHTGTSKSKTHKIFLFTETIVFHARKYPILISCTVEPRLKEVPRTGELVRYIENLNRWSHKSYPFISSCPLKTLPQTNLAIF